MPVSCRVEFDGDPGRKARIVFDQGNVGFQALAAREVKNAFEQIGGHQLSGNLIPLRIVQRPADINFHFIIGDFVGCRHRVADQHAAANAEMFAHLLEVGDGLWAVQAQRAVQC